jgi:pimeloyl-ACP methyl ester carboxylesterase
VTVQHERPRAGTLAGGFSYVRVGDGHGPLVVLPDLALDNHTPGRREARAYASGFRRLTAEHTVYVLHRRRNLPAGASTRDLAAEYADLLWAEWGRVRLMGLSAGGMIAQHLALDHPQLVERLILVVTGARLSRPGMDICEHWCWLAMSRQWRRLRAELATAAIDGHTAQRVARTFVAMSEAVVPALVDAADFVTTVDAVMEHNTTRELPTLRMPTLVVGGADDPFFPGKSLRETAAGIPNATVSVHAGAGHGLPRRDGRRWQSEVLSFLGTQ